MLLLLSLTAFLAASPVQAADLCERGKNARITKGFDDPAVLKSLELSPDERIDIMCQVKDAVLRSYVLTGFKQQRLQINAQKLLSACVLAETKAPDNKRLPFLDRARKCIAGFRDTHFGAYPKIAPPAVLTAVGAGMADDKVVITTRYPKLLGWIETRDGIKNIKELLPIGAEILEIDGVPAYQAVSEMGKYIPASTNRSRNLRAAISLLSRNFLYPAKNTVDLKVKLADGSEQSVRLPWWSSSSITNVADANAELKRLGIESLDELKWNYDAKTGAWSSEDIATEGFSLRNSLVKGVTTYNNSETSTPALRTGEILLDRKRAFCYLQLLTFNAAEVKLDNGEPQEFLEPIKAFAQGCEEKQLPMLLDLRANGGGNPMLAHGVMAILTRKGEKSSTTFWGFRATKYSAWLLSLGSNSRGTGAALLVQPDSYALAPEALAGAIKANVPYTDLLIDADVAASLKEGFNQKVVTLVSSECVSACDIMAGMLKANKRSTFVGNHTNGTGAGYMSEDLYDAEFRDTYQVFQFKVPNIYFGMNQSKGLPTTLPFEENKHLISENRPTVAGVQYSTTQQDLTGQGSGWLERGVRELMKE